MWIAFDNSYARLPERFHARVSPTPVAAPRLIRLNVALAESLGLDPAALASPDGVAMLAGNRVEAGSEPIAAAYAGHQFGGFSPQLGDGRAILLGEIIGRDGIRRDLQLKGSGRTPFSRGGDGRAALGPVLREYLISEAMWALGIKTTRSLAAVLTGEAVARETMLPGAVLTRVATSHIRVGTFQFFAARGDLDATRLLADHVIARHYPDAAHAARPYRALLDAVVAAQADLVARWLLIGFIHGVMNTDNTSVAGETIDYGPCAFMDAYDPATVFSSIDHAGRYAYSNQPSIAHWNVARLAEALMPLMDTDEGRALEQAKESLGAFAGQFETAYMGGLARKIGLQTERQGDAALIRPADPHGHWWCRLHAHVPAPVRAGCRHAGPHIVHGSRRLRCVGGGLARAAGARRRRRGKSWHCHARDQPGVHTAQPSRAGRDRRRRGTPGFRALRGVA